MTSTCMFDKGDPTPFWFLDVDGVVNCWPDPRKEDIDNHGPYDEYEIVRNLGSGLAETLKIFVRPPVIDFINRVNRDGLARVVWLTSWKNEAPDVLAPLVGLDAFPVLHSTTKNKDAGSPYWLKKTAVESVMDGFGGKMVWTDDDIPFALRSAMKNKYEGRALIIRPDSQPGLADKHLRAIEAHLTC
jgi:hypothetical protein